MFQNCPGVGHVPAFMICCKDLMRGVSSLFHFCMWKAETNKSCLWAFGSSLFVTVVWRFKIVLEMALKLHSSHLNIGFIAMSWLEVCLNFSSYVREMKKSTRVTQLCTKTGEETWWLTQLSNHAQKTCAIGLCCRHHHNAQCIHTNIRLVFGHYGGYHPPSCVFLMPQTSSRITTFTGI